MHITDDETHEKMKLVHNPRRRRLVLGACLIHHGAIQHVDINMCEWQLHCCRCWKRRAVGRQTENRTSRQP